MPRRTRATRRALWIGAVTVGLLGASACADRETASAPTTTEPTTTEPTTAPPTTTEPTTTGFPGAEWESTDPATAGFDPAALDAIAAAAQAAGSSCFLVQRSGKIVIEQYGNGTTSESTQEVFSASKSVTSTLAGIAHTDGDLDVTDPASDYITDWKGTPSESVTVEQLLSNDSGREHGRRTDYVEMAAKADDKTAYSIALTQTDPPGAVWAYNNAAIQTLEAVLSTSTGRDVAEFADDRLFDPIGMSRTSIAKDRSGNPLTFMGTQSNCRDLARFGVLMLHEGDWDGTRILDAEWVRQATGRSSQDLNSAYGWLWWLNRPGTVLGANQASGDSPADAGADGSADQLVPGAPDDMYWALGFANQVVAIDPGSDTVVVRLGPASTPEGTPKFGPQATARVVTEALLRDG